MGGRPHIKPEMKENLISTENQQSMSNILNEIKKEYAKEKYLENAEAMARALNFPAINEIATRYAVACCKATLERAAENAICEPGENKGYGPIDRSSINDPDNIVIL